MSRLERVLNLKSALGPTHFAANSWYISLCKNYRLEVDTITLIHSFYPEKNL